MTNGEVKFNHNISTARIKNVNGKPVLMQDGLMFSNAELNKFTGKYEPEPEYIAPYEPLREMLIPKVLDLVEQIQTLNDTISQLIEPIKLVIAHEPIQTRPENPTPTEYGITENSFKYLGASKLNKWVENNKEAISCLDEDSDVLTALIEKWEKTYDKGFDFF